MAMAFVQLSLPGAARALSQGIQVGNFGTKHHAFTKGQGHPAGQSESGWSRCQGVATLVATAAIARKTGMRQSRVRTAADRQAASLVATPGDTYNYIADRAVQRASQSTLQTLKAGIMGGCYIGFAGLLSLAIGGKVNPDDLFVANVIFAALFPVCILLILQSGSQLSTTNFGTMAVGLFEKKVKKRDLVKNWFVSYLGNMLGCLLMAAMSWYTGQLAMGTDHLAMKWAVHKCSSGFGQAVAKGVLCNWLISVATFLAWSAEDLAGKMVGIWFPISMYIAVGFEHSVTNMFLIPMGMLAGAPITVAGAFWKNLIPVTIGNMFAGVTIFAAGLSFSFGSLGKGK